MRFRQRAIVAVASVAMPATCAAANGAAGWIGFGILGWVVALGLWWAHRRAAALQQHLASASDTRLSEALHGSGLGLWSWNLGTRRVSWSSAERIAGSAGDHSMAEQHWRSQVVHRDDRAQVERALADHVEGRAPHYEAVYRARSADGSWVWIRAVGKLVERDANGRPLRITGTFRGIDRERQEAERQRIAEAVVEHMLEGVSITDTDFRFESVNPAFERVTGYSASELIGQPASMLNSLQHPPSVYVEMRRKLAERGSWSGELWQKQRSGADFLAQLQVSCVRNDLGQVSHYVAVMSDITDRKRAEHRLRFLAHYDTLTGLPNRAFVRQRLRQLLEGGPDRRVALLFLDLDRFKHINDSLGHKAGDELLRQAAKRLRLVVGDLDRVGRLGGDEFTALLIDVNQRDEIEHVAAEILDSFSGPLLVMGHEVAISPSIGIAVYPDDGRSLDELLQHADAAMYQAKAQGRNTYRFYSHSLAEDAHERTRLESALRRALDRNELSLVYQPKLSLRSGRISGVEALMRWHSGELGEISPARFIPIAEETGLIVAFGEWALRQSLSQFQRWQEQGLPVLRIAVNVSQVQMARPDFVDLVKHLIESHQLPAGVLEIELTESVLMADPDRAGKAVADLRALGVRVSIDDFGTGYSSLSYLRGLAIDAVKIDKSFVDGIENNVDDEVLTSTIVLMAHSLGLAVVAEGVESERQLTFLRGENCDEIQGYWLAKPMDPELCRSFIQSFEPPKRLVLPGARG